MSKRLELTGKKFGRLTVIELAYIKKFTYWKCLCDCGKKCIIAGCSLRRGQTKSCGCLKLTIRLVHGMCKTTFYKIWSNMKNRCYNRKTERYYCYGDRGIRICDRWLKFINFRDDMYESYKEHVKKYGENDTTIDRTDNNGNYCLKNCSWKTIKEQANNKRNNYLMTCGKQTMNMTQWAKKLNIPYNVLQARIHILNWSVEKALTTPVRKQI